MKEWKIWLGLILVFLSGLVIGAGSTKLYIRHKYARAWHKGPDAMRKSIMDRLTKELDLVQPQQSAIEKIVGETQSKLLKIRAQYQPEIDEIVEGCIAQMKMNLSAEQQAKLDGVYERIKKKWHTLDR